MMNLDQMLLIDSHNEPLSESASYTYYFNFISIRAFVFSDSKHVCQRDWSLLTIRRLVTDGLCGNGC